MKNATVLMVLSIIVFSFLSGIMTGTAMIMTVPFKYENAKADLKWVCQGGFFSYSVDVVTYSPTVTQVVREWEEIDHSWYKPAGSFSAVVESERQPWQLWTKPNRKTFYEIEKVPNDAPIGMIQFQQGAHSGLLWDTVFTIDVEVRECP